MEATLIMFIIHVEWAHVTKMKQKFVEIGN